MRYAYLIVAGFLLAVSVLLLASLTIKGVEGKAITVDDDGGADFDTIQAAINDAEEGDTVLISAGTYQESLVINKTLTLEGKDWNTTFIDGNGANETLNITAPDCVISNFTVTGGARRGILVSASAELFWVKSQGNQEDGLHVEYGTDNNRFENCIFEDNGEYGILLERSNRNSIQNCSFNNNSIGICLVQMSVYSKILDNSFSGNNNGIALGYDCNGNEVERNTFLNNEYAGIYVNPYSDRNKILSNHCEGNRIGIYVGGYSTENTISKNNCVFNSEAGLILHAASYNSGSGNVLSHNDVGIEFRLESKNNGFSECQISNNRCGIQVSERSFSNSVSHCNIEHNTEWGVNASEWFKAKESWWGSEKGPYDPIENPGGKGDNISEDVSEYDPWLKKPFDYFDPISTIELVSPDTLTEGDDLRLSGSGEAYGGVQRYLWWSTIDSVFYSGESDTITLTNLSAGEHTLYFQVLDSLGVWSAEDSTKLTVLAIPVAEIISITPNPAVFGDELEFTGKGTGGVAVQRYVWSLAGEELYNDSEASFKHPGLSAGEHYIVLLVQGENGVWSLRVQAALTILADGDGDKVPDVNDSFPNDPSASVDSDGDGYPDQWNPGKFETDSTTELKLDAFPTDPNKWEEKDDGGDSTGFEPGFLVLGLALLSILLNHAERRRK